jgi:hypothetical protein
LPPSRWPPSWSTISPSSPLPTEVLCERASRIFSQNLRRGKRSDQRSIVVASGEPFRFQPGTYQAEHGLDGHIRCSGHHIPPHAGVAWRIAAKRSSYGRVARRTRSSPLSSAKSSAAEGSGCRETDGVGAGENDGRDLLQAHAMTLRINVAITRMARTTPYPSERDPMVKSRSKISLQPVKKSKKTAARRHGGLYSLL